MKRLLGFLLLLAQIYAGGWFFYHAYIGIRYRNEMRQTQEEKLEPVSAPSARDYMEALEDAVSQAMRDLRASGVDRSLKVAAVPLDGDEDDRCYELTRNALTAAGFEVFNRQAHEWQPLLDEIDWGQRRGDVMDPATIQRFGDIQGVAAVFYGRLLDRETVKTDDGAAGITLVRLNLHASMVETGRHAWGTSVVGRSTPPEPVPFHARYAWVLLIAGGILLVLMIGWIAILRSTRPL